MAVQLCSDLEGCCEQTDIICRRFLHNMELILTDCLHLRL